jgi:hypothetical protein
MTTDADLPIDRLRTGGGGSMRVAVVTRAARADNAELGSRVQFAACRAYLATLPAGSWVMDSRGMAEGGDVLHQVAPGWTDEGSREALRRAFEAVAGYDLVLVHRMDRISRHLPTAREVVDELRAAGVRLVAVVEHEDRVVEYLANVLRAVSQGDVDASIRITAGRSGSTFWDTATGVSHDREQFTGDCRGCGGAHGAGRDDDEQHPSPAVLRAP